MRRVWATLIFGLALLLGAPAPNAHAREAGFEPVFHADGRPRALDDWGVVKVQDGRLVLGAGVVPYALNTPLFTDYARKLRTVWMPQGTSAVYREGEIVDFPVGTIISKTFYYPTAEDGSGAVLPGGDPVRDVTEAGLALDGVRLMETRLLIRREDGWTALPYVWNEDQTQARLKRVGAVLSLEIAYEDGSSEAFPYVVPNTNQCAGCHAVNNTTRAVQPIGPKPRHLNGDYVYAAGTENQLTHWSELGLLSGAPDPSQAPRNAVWEDNAASLNDRARAYLDANCTHCHNPVGPADTSGLHLNPATPMGPALGRCKPPIAAGSGTGGHRYGIVPGKPEESIFVFRLETTDTDKMMPELGRSLSHRAGVALIREWIAELDGACG